MARSINQCFMEYIKSFNAEMEAQGLEPIDLNATSEIAARQWSQIERMIVRWEDNLKARGVDFRNPTTVKNLSKALAEGPEGETATQKLITVLDEEISKHINNVELNAATTKLVAQYQSAKQFVRLKEQVELIASNRFADDPEGKAKALHDIVSTPEDPMKGHISMEETIGTRKAEFFGEGFLKRVHEEVPEIDPVTMWNDPELTQDIAREFFRNADETNGNVWKTQNKTAQKVAAIIKDALDEATVRRGQLGDKVDMKANKPMPKFSYSRLRAKAKDKFNRVSETKMTKVIDDAANDIAPHLSARKYGDIATRQKIARDMLASMHKNRGHVDWKEVPDVRSVDDIHYVDNFDAYTADELDELFQPILEFENGDSWLAVNKAWGEGKFEDVVYGQFLEHGRRMGVLETFGPFWSRNFEDLLDEAARGDGGNILANKRNSGVVRRAKADFERQTKANFLNYEWSGALVRGLRVGRGIETAAKLGSAVVSAMMDVPIMLHMGKTMYNVPYHRTFMNIAQSFGGSKTYEGRQYLRMVTGSFEYMLGKTHQRFDLVDDGRTLNGLENLTDNMAHMVMKYSGMENWNETMKGISMGAIRGQIGHYIHEGTNWSALDDQFQNSLKNMDISEANWNKIVNDKTLDKHGNFDLFQIDDMEMKTKMRTFLMDAQNRLVITPGIRDVNNVGLYSKQGSVWEAFARTFMQFKTFPLTMTRKLLYRQAIAKDPTRSRGKQSLAILGGYTGMMYPAGMILAQAKTMLNGNDPYSYDNPQLYLDAALFSGTFGIVQDGAMGMLGADLAYSLFGEKARREDVGSMIVGPLFQDMWRIGQGATQTALGGARAAVTGDFEDGEYMRKGLSKTTRTLMHMAPGSSLWYFKPIWRTAFIDGVHEMLDPTGYWQKVGRRMRDQEKRTPIGIEEVRQDFVDARSEAVTGP